MALMSIPPVPNHPPRPGRRKPAEETPDSITTQLFIGQDKSPQADGSTQALSAEEIDRLKSMVSADGAAATEVLSLEELRAIAAAEGGDPEVDEPAATPRKVNSSDLAEAEAAAAPRQWNPQGTPHYGGAEGVTRPAEGFGAAAPGQFSPQVSQQGRPSGGTPRGGTPAPAGAAYAAGYQNGGYPGPGGPAGPGGPTGPGGPGGPGPAGGPGGPYRREPETAKVPAWLWVLASIALVLAIGIVGYIVWDSMQSTEETASAPESPSLQPTPAPTESQGSETSSPPAAVETFASPSGNIECTIDADRARCVIASFDYTPPERPEDCQMDNWGSVVVANGEGAGFSCREAPASSGPARVLGYGESISASGMTCTSAEDGMTCTADDTGVGFTMRRASVDFLGD